MIISSRRTPSTPLSPLLLEGQPLDQVKIFKYLNPWPSLQMILQQCAKNFSALTVYLPSLVPPWLCLGHLVPSHEKDKVANENIQKHSETCVPHGHQTWNGGYQDLLDLVDLPIFECQRLETVWLICDKEGQHDECCLECHLEYLYQVLMVCGQ